MGEEFPFDHTLSQTNSSLSVSSQRFHFSAKMDEHPELAGKAFRDEFLEISKRLPPKAQTLTKSLLKASKSTRKTRFFLKKANFLQDVEQLRDLFHEINPDTSIENLLSTHLAILKSKRASDYLLINNFAFSNSIYEITKKHISFEKSTHTFSKHFILFKQNEYIDYFGRH